MNLTTTPLAKVQADIKHQAAAFDYANTLTRFGAETKFETDTIDNAGHLFFTINLTVKGRLIGSYGSWKEAAAELKVLSKLAPVFRSN